jgi:hypothetical protein
MSERRWKSVMLFLVIAATLTCSAPANPDLLGLWESTQTSKGGIGHTIEFRSDGTFVEAVTVLVNMHYRVIGDRLFVDGQPIHDDVDPSRSVKISFEADRMFQAGPDGSSVVRERVGTAVAGAPSVVGAWRYRHYSGGIAFERYTPDGMIFFRLPMTSSVDCYRVKDNKIQLSKPDKEETIFSYELKGKELQLTETVDEHSVYLYWLEDFGPWYDREHIDYVAPD